MSGQRRQRIALEEVADMLDEVDVVDAHHHLWSHTEPSDKGDFDLLGDDSAMPTRYLAADFRSDAAPARLVGSVELGGYSVDACESEGLRDGIPSVLVPAAHLETEAGRDGVRALAAHPAVRGVRQILNWHRDAHYRFIDEAHLMDDASWRAGLEVLGEHELSFDLQIYPSQMSDAARLVRDFPWLFFVLNHLGMPLGRDPETLAEWRGGLAQLAEATNVSVKLSGFGMTDHAWSTDSTLPLLETAIGLFGPERCMFASNFPVDRLFGSYADILAVVAGATRALSTAERGLVFAGTARRVYRIVSSTPPRTPKS